uniref:Putative secreted protein n=1 Tax=Rhipicephalus microplus TaxID=6941 RepID=A0A6M2DE71_RHIMP
MMAQRCAPLCSFVRCLVAAVELDGPNAHPSFCKKGNMCSAFYFNTCHLNVHELSLKALWYLQSVLQFCVTFLPK